MQYMLLIYDNEATWQNIPEAERETIFMQYMEFTQGIVKSGHFRAGDRVLECVLGQVEVAEPADQGGEHPARLATKDLVEDVREHGGLLLHRGDAPVRGGDDAKGSDLD